MSSTVLRQVAPIFSWACSELHTTQNGRQRLRTQDIDWTFFGTVYDLSVEKVIPLLFLVPSWVSIPSQIIWYQASLFTARNKVGQGYIFTGVCDSVSRGGVLPPGWGAPPRGRCASSYGVWWRPPGMATAVSGRHPTGMHSCYICVHFVKCLTYYVWWPIHCPNCVTQPMVGLLGKKCRHCSLFWVYF